MIDYKLAKELREAGFPQGWREGMSYYDRNCVYVASGCSEYNHDLDVGWKIPTLEELIKACGERFYNLIQSDDVWIAASVEEEEKDKWIFSGSETGKTPIEAVARLWLALNKK